MDTFLVELEAVLKMLVLQPLLVHLAQETYFRFFLGAELLKRAFLNPY